MAILTKEQFLETIDRLCPETDENSLTDIENLTDTYNSLESGCNNEEFEKLKNDYITLKKNYRDRFLNGSTDDTHKNQDTPKSFDDLFN